MSPSSSTAGRSATPKRSSVGGPIRDPRLRVDPVENPHKSSRGPGGGAEPPIPGTKPAKSCTDACSSSIIVYRPAATEGRMTVRSVSGDIVPLSRVDRAAAAGRTDRPEAANDRSMAGSRAADGSEETSRPTASMGAEILEACRAADNRPIPRCLIAYASHDTAYLMERPTES